MHFKEDELTARDIECMLDEQLELSAEDRDESLVEECLLYLYPEYENGDMPGEKESRDKLLQIWKVVEREKNNSYLNIKKLQHPRLQPVMVMLTVLMSFVLLGTGIAYAFGYPIWNYVFHWGDDQARIVIEIEAPINSPELTATNQYFGLGKADAFEAKLKDLQMNPVLPLLPKEYTLTNIDSSGSDSLRNIVGFYSDGDSKLHVSITRVNDSDTKLSEIIEKDGDEREVIVMNGTSYYLFHNIDTSEAAWISPPYVIQLGGDISRDALKLIITTMNGDISND